MALLTPKQAAALACVSLSLIYAVLHQGKLPALRVGCRGRGKWLIQREDFDNWLQSLKVSELSESEGPLKYL